MLELGLDFMLLLIEFFDELIGLFYEFLTLLKFLSELGKFLGSRLRLVEEVVA